MVTLRGRNRKRPEFFSQGQVVAQGHAAADDDDSSLIFSFLDSVCVSAFPLYSERAPVVDNKSEEATTRKKQKQHKANYKLYPREINNNQKEEKEKR